MTETVVRLDRRLAEQFLVRHLQLLGGDEMSGFRFHRAAARRFLAGFCRFDDQAGTEQLVLSDERLLAWLSQEARRRTTASAGVCFLCVSRYLDGLVEAGLLRGNPLADFQARHGCRGWPVLAAALQSADPGAALRLLQPRFEKPGPIRPHVERYLELHQATGKDFGPNKSLLIHLDRFLGAQGTPSPCGITTEAMERWANAIGGNARTRFKKVRMAWNFFGYLLDLKVLTTNPITPVLYSLGRLPRSTFKPFIFAKDQVEAVLCEARQLPGNAQFPLRAETCSLIFSLLYRLGLRIGEACRLRIRDVSLPEATLFIDQTKFYKSRYVPFGRGLGRELKEFLELRRARHPALGRDSPVFVASGASQVDRSGLNNTFRAIVDRLGIHGGPGYKPPRPHDLRHSFAVHRLLRWYQDGEDIQSKLPLLSTFLGHLDPTSTQVYLTISAPLLHEASAAFYQRFGCLFDTERDG